MRRAVLCAATIVASLVVHTVAGRWLAGRDVVLAVLASERGWAIAAIAALLAARLFLFLLAPGWALYVLITVALARAGARRR
jgi:hypothetical protein